MPDATPAGCPGGGAYDLSTAQFDFPDFAGMPRQSILLCSHPRSGSTLLGEALHFGELFGCPLEYYHVGFRPSFALRWNAYDIASYHAAVTRHRTGPNGVFSAKLFWRDVVELAQEVGTDLSDAALAAAPGDTPDGVYRALGAQIETFFGRPTIIHLRRLDRVRQAVSAALATDTGVWRHVGGRPDAGSEAPVAYDPDRIERLVGYSDFCHGHWDRLVEVMGWAAYPMRYESLIADFAGEVRALFDWLGQPQAPQPSRMLRQADHRNEAMVQAFLRDRAMVSR